jgi:hypothetical protein
MARFAWRHVVSMRRTITPEQPTIAEALDEEGEYSGRAAHV